MTVPLTDADVASILEDETKRICAGGEPMTNWSTCPAVERNPHKLSGAWAFTGTRVPVYALFENLASGATIDEFVEWFPGVEKQQVQVVLELEAEALRKALAR